VLRNPYVQSFSNVWLERVLISNVNLTSTRPQEQGLLQSLSSAQEAKVGVDYQ